MTKDMKNNLQCTRDFFIFDDEENNCENQSCCVIECNEIKPPHPHCEKQDDENCCCKNALKKSLNLLLNPCLKTLIDLTKFTLIGRNFTTADGATTLKSVANCENSMITYTDGSGNLTMTTLCDLIAIKFALRTPTESETEEELLSKFINAVTKCLPKINPKKYCCSPEDECCCNKTKASFLANSIGPVNIQLDSSAAPTNPLTELNIITVTKDVAWFVDSNNNIYIVCLNSIVALG